MNKRRTDYYRTLLETCGMGLEDRLNVKAGTLSGGQRQALALILANMTDIELLILDEHTAALDPKSSETVMRITDKLVKEKQVTSLMVTHNLRFALEYGSRLGNDARGAAAYSTCAGKRSRSSKSTRCSRCSMRSAWSAGIKENVNPEKRHFGETDFFEGF